MSTVPLIVVTGASRGIGLYVARTLLTKYKTRVLSLSRSRTPELDKLAQDHPSYLNVVQCDIADEAATKSALDTCDRIDGLVLNAAIVDLSRVSSENFSLDTWKRLFDVNFFSLVHTIRSSLPKLRESKGKIVFVSSGSAVGGLAAHGAYNASKAAMNSLCRTIANEEPDITSVAIRPGMVDTDMQVFLRSQGASEMKESEHKRFTDAHASGALVQPIDSGNVISSLVLKASHDLSGKFISWDAEEMKVYRE